MRKKLSRIGVMFAAILTVMVCLFARPVSANALEDNCFDATSGVTYKYKMDTSKPYARIKTAASGNVRITFTADQVYPRQTVRLEIYNSIGERVNKDFDQWGRNRDQWNAGNETTLVAAMDKTFNLPKDTYYIYVYPSYRSGDYNHHYDNKESFPECWAKTVQLKITYPTPAPSPKITKVSTGNKKAWIYWNPMAGATKYRVYVIQNGVEKLAGTTTQTKLLVKDMTNGIKANYYVKAVVNGRLTTQKNIAYSTPRNGVKPTLSISSGKCHIAWSKYPGAAKYMVVKVDANNRILDTRETKGTSFDWNGLNKGQKLGFYVVPYVNGEYIPFGRSYAEDKANIMHFTAR